ncbi:MAG TPA: metal ABC transporter ATP-binding protein [Dehalococcoidia bacterium]|nr:metal ABC transporter ATP-binding protein [Dehalococcoidia bacterium]
MSVARTPRLQLSHVTVRYGDRTALEDVSMTVEPGSYVGVLGPNGSGKTTLIRAILGSTPLSAGAVTVDGLPARSAKGVFAYVPQTHQIALDMPLTVWDVVLMGRLPRLRWHRRYGRHDREVAAWALERVHLADERNRLIGELSGGQQQRAFIARALAQEGRILLLDEPLTGVDAVTQEIVLRLLANLHADGLTILIATHDLSSAAGTCDTLCLLNRRLVAYGPMRETFTPAALRETFGRHVHLGEGIEADHPELVEHVILH